MDNESIGSYRILRQIGAGGTAKVYLAVHQDVPNMQVILKILSDPRLGDRFLQEADKLALLDGHPNICRIKHFFNHGDETVIAMEYIDGASLDQRIKEARQLSVTDSLRIAAEVLDILDFAHRKKIYHRDIKPGNIMIDSRGQTKVIDFGIAKAETDPNLTAVGSCCGTPAYMAPEQFNPTEDTNNALIDIYAVGSTLYVMLTGQVPFGGDNPFAIRDAKMFEDPPSPRQSNSLVTQELEDVILKSLARDPSQRYQTCREMINALKGLSDSPIGEMTAQQLVTPDSATEEFVTPPAGTRSKKTKKKKPSKPLLIGLIGASVVAIAAVLYFGLGRSDNGGSEPVVAVTDTVPSDTIPVTGTIDVKIAPEGDLYIDDSLLAAGTQGLQLETDTGRHVIRVENAKARTKMRTDTVWVADGYTVSREYSFTIPEQTRPKPPPKSTTGKVMVGSEPRGATVFIDGRKQEHQTIFTFELAVGQHTIRVEKIDAGSTLSGDTTFVVKADPIHRIKFDLRK